ncbi:putative 8-oxo-dGTP diphosphatase YtkD [Paraliobacillus quinghaiensis]|uniref:8-oxo-dGTP diphosphatase YtkD n=1 Tax=Paraliobacillus quinghaiensis TaxID=470815 RepID=A0A917TTK6_9BACI|nr:nucleoside triphosphatase YtkD [Paraliobacillus quinghaiensis]GGM36947.1 putative 8-oxo-dGTP diphosphatase YtkD [Paraliobacillus quinghaiensis]
MKKFYDYYHNEVKLSFEDHPFKKDPKHVWVICRWQEQWLLTKHKERGIEFPGGKVEPGETAAQAAIREVSEETGGEVRSLTYIGQYYVKGKSEDVVKNIYFAVIDELAVQPSYFETEGPVLLKELPEKLRTNPTFSFMMKDQVLPYSLERVQQLVE